MTSRFPLCLGVALFAVTACGSTSGDAATAPLPGGTASVSPSAAPAPSLPATSVPASSPSSSTPPVASTVPPDRDPTNQPLPSPTSTKVTVTGIPKPGVAAGCLLLDGYLLTGGDRALLTSGARVTVTGHVEPELASYCQQGIIIVVDTVTPAG